MKWKYFVVINLLCMLTVGYLGWHLGLAQGKAACIKEYFAKPIQAEVKFVLETSQLIQCESGNRHEIWGDNNNAFGFFQFWQATFNDFVKEANMEDMKMDWKNPEHQYRVWKWAYYNGKLNRWTCYKEVEF